jgi:general secretion pathway protein B
MSLILEALRKSEAERRRGQAPDLHAELPPLAAARPKRIPAWLGVGAAVVVLAGAVWWLSSPRAPQVAETPAPLAAKPTQPLEPVVDPTFPPVERIEPAPVARMPVTPEPAEPIEPAGRTPAPPMPTAVPIRTSPAASATTGTGSAAPVAGTTATDPAAQPAPPTPKRPSASVTGRTAVPPSVAELPAAERGQLPELKLTMHMWDQQPGQRFIILDGNRYGEGDRVGAAVISRIDPDGVILELNGRAVRLPLR